MTNVKKRDWFSFLQFRDIVLWDVKRYFKKAEIFNESYPIKKFNYFAIKPIINSIKIEDNKKYKIIGVKSYGKGAFVNREVLGSTLKMKKYHLLKPNYLYWCKVDTKNGAFGIINESLSDGIASTNMNFLELDTSKIHTKYLQLIFSNKKFFSYLDGFVSGTTNRQYINAQDLLNNISIPLPTLEIQQNIIEAYYLKMKKAFEQDNKARDKEQEINKYLLSSLGVNLKKSIKQKGITYTKYSLIDRWAADYLFNLSSIKGITEAKYPVQKIRKFILSIQYGLSSKASERPIGIPMLRMNNIYKSELDIHDLKYISIQNEKKEKILLEKGDLLFNRTNSKELVGKTAVFDLNEEFTFASYLIRLKLDQEKVNVYFINYLLNSPIGRVQIDMISRQVLGQANVNAQELLDFIFPIPDLKTQNAIVKDVSKIKKAANSLKEKAELNRKEAIIEFENAIFKS